MEKILKGRVATVGVGFVLHRIINSTYSLFISPFIIMHFVFWQGVSILFVCSLVIWSILIRLYDLSKTDWILIESFKKAQAETDEQLQHHNKITRFIVRWSKKGRIAVIIALICWDPLVAVLYHREGYFRFNGIPRNTMLVFISSALACNFAWACLIMLVANVCKFVAGIF